MGLPSPEINGPLTGELSSPNRGREIATVGFAGADSTD
jgi:hypothetical protein